MNNSTSFVVQLGEEWYEEHTDHIELMLDRYSGPANPPSHEDLHQPSLWKAGSWLWFKELRGES